MNLEQIYLNSNAHNILKNDIENGMRHHAYFLVGDDGDTLTLFAKNMAKQMLCNNIKDSMFCNVCRICKNIDLGIFSDCLMFPKSATFKVEDSNAVVAESIVAPFEGNLKVIILNNFDQSTIASQNKLLKTLEEPNTQVVFIICAKNASSVLDTIKSRSKKVLVYENIKRNQTELEFFENHVNKLLDSFNHSSQILQKSSDIMEADDTALKWLNAYQTVLTKSLENKLQKLNVPTWANVFTPQALTNLFYNTITAEKQINANCNKQLVLENLLINFLEVRLQCQQ